MKLLTRTDLYSVYAAGAAFVVGYSLMLGYVYGLHWLGMLPLACVLMLASTAVAAMLVGPGAGSLAICAANAGRRRTAFQSISLLAMLFPLVLGTERTLEHDELSPRLVISGLVISALLTMAVIGALRWCASKTVKAAADMNAGAKDTLTTTRQELEDARQARAKAELMIENRAHFLARMSHELRTPLTSMLGFAQLMDLDAADPLTTKQRSKLVLVERAGLHLQRLVDDITDLTRIDTGHLNMHLDMVPLHAVLEGTVDLLQPMANELGVTLERPVVDCGVFVWADEIRLGQILMNLISNALKYNRRGGSVWFSVQPDSRPEDRGAIQTVAIVVHDTGQGIAPVNLRHLFEPFNRLGQEFGNVPGSGLGLALSLALAHLMQGHIEASSRLGVGTQMTLTLRCESH